MSHLKLHCLLILFLAITITFSNCDQVVVVSGGTRSEYTAFITRGTTAFKTVTRLSEAFENVQTVDIMTKTSTVTVYA
jgi:hypothetical protein